MTVLVTGGAGYIGSHMVHALVDAGERVVVIDNLSTGFSSLLPRNVPLFIGDAGDENFVENVIAQHRIESIIHFAGSVVVLSFEQIDTLLGFALPVSARTETDWWKAGGAVPNAHCSAWTGAGRTASPNLLAGHVVFERHS